MIAGWSWLARFQVEVSLLRALLDLWVKMRKPVQMKLNVTPLTGEGLYKGESLALRVNEKRVIKREEERASRREWGPEL